MPGAMISDNAAREAVELVRTHGSVNAAARAANMGWGAIHRRLVRAAERGLDGGVPQPVAPGRRIKGVSTLYDRNGNVAAQWVKDTAEGQDALALAEAFADVFREWRGHARPRPAPADTLADLLTVYPIVDLHHGLSAPRGPHNPPRAARPCWCARRPCSRRNIRASRCGFCRATTTPTPRWPWA